MRQFNWKMFVVPLVPTVSILHTRWLCYLLDGEWGTHSTTAAAVMVAGLLTILAAMWATGFKG